MLNGLKKVVKIGSILKGLKILAKNIITFSKSEIFVVEIEKMLGPPGYGSCRETNRLPSGKSITHYCSYITGMSYLIELSRYRSHFGEPPSWLKICHPFHRTLLFRIAFKKEKKLPETTYEVIPYIKDYQITEKLNHSVMVQCREDKKVDLNKALPTLFKDAELKKNLCEKFGQKNFESIISMMKKGEFSGGLGDELHDYLIETINDDCEIAWEGLMRSSEDEDSEEESYSIWISEYKGVFFLQALEYDEEGYFLSLDDAKEYMYSAYFYVFDKKDE